jgi:hypothetical protein
MVFAVLCLVGYFAILYNAKKIRNSKYWAFWWIISLLMLAQTLPVFELVFGVISDKQTEVIFPYFISAAICIFTVLAYINVIGPIIKYRKG